ncbi:MAG: pentapeptide repeat-containing protein [Magnetococcales bacterium]|nr:pentapeptide repeat-containing protein [Magnetococcales bacterium]
MKGADMKGTDFRHAHMTSASFAGANLREADFCGVTFDKPPVFKNADLSGAIFSIEHEWLREFHPKAIFKN